MSDRPNDAVDRPDTTEFAHFDGPDGRMDDELLYRFATERTTPQETQQVTEWRARSAENEARFHDVVAVLLLTADADEELRFGPAPTAHEILNNGKVRASRFTRAWRVALLVSAAAVAGVAVALPVAQRTWNPPAATSAGGFGSDEFATETEPATVGLRDGSVVRLAPATRLRVHDRQDGREVSLIGRGFFAVARDAALPFTVRTDAGTVTVLGTRFDLSVVGEDLRLIVIEGTVRLTVRGAQVVVREGQLAQVLKGNLVPPIDVPDPASLVGWMGNFIAFQDTPLRTVVREVEQLYRVRIELSDPDVGEQTVTALFAGRSFEEIVEVICVVAHLQCTRVGDVMKMAPAR